MNHEEVLDKVTKEIVTILKLALMQAGNVEHQYGEDLSQKHYQALVISHAIIFSHYNLLERNNLIDKATEYIHPEFWKEIETFLAIFPGKECTHE